MSAVYITLIVYFILEFFLYYVNLIFSLKDKKLFLCFTFASLFRTFNVVVSSKDKTLFFVLMKGVSQIKTPHLNSD